MYIESVKTVNEMTHNELVKLTTLWTTGPWVLFISSNIPLGDLRVKVMDSLYFMFQFNPGCAEECNWFGSALLVFKYVNLSTTSIK